MKKIIFNFLAIFLFLPSSAQVEEFYPQGYGPNPQLVRPYETKSVSKRTIVTGWPKDKLPQVLSGFTVTRFADRLNNPRWLYVLPDGDILVAEAGKFGITSANRIMRLRDADGDGIADTKTVFLEGLNRPFGMAVVGNYFYVANTDGLMRFPYQNGQERIESSGRKILDLPAGGYNNHWTRNILVAPDKKSLFVSVGSGSNNAEHGIKNEIRRANILQVDLDGKNEKIFASGLRNPVGMDFNPNTEELWTAVNERDELGDELVPDYITSVKEGGFYGWPYSYYGQNEDPRMQGKNPELVAKAVVPDYATGAHTASLGLAFSRNNNFPVPFNNGAFVAQHGSWNKSKFAGYKVIFVPFEGGNPSGPPIDFLTGFLNTDEANEAYGRPVGIFDDHKGGLLVTDDASDTIWRIAYKKQ